MEFIKIILYYPFINLLTFYIWLVPGHHVVWGVILLTLTVRMLLLIPSKRQAQSQRKIQQLNPLLEELKKEYKDDREGLARAQMELYKKNNINPFGSCGLALIQLPILIILYYAILRGIGADSPHIYAWIPRPTDIETVLFGIDLLKPDRTFIIPAIAAVLQYVQMQLTLPAHMRVWTSKEEKAKHANTKPDAAMAMQKNMAIFFPVLTLLIAGQFPGAVAVYWVVSTAFSIVQQFYVNKERMSLAGVETALEEAEEVHPEAAPSQKKKAAVIAETTATKKGVTVKVRRKGNK